MFCFFFVCPFSKAGGCRSLELIFLYTQVPPENSKAGHEYVDTQEMRRADVARISAGPFHTIAANIQHLFWLSRMVLCLFISLLSCLFSTARPCIYIFLSVPPIKTDLESSLFTEG